MKKLLRFIPIIAIVIISFSCKSTKPEIATVVDTPEEVGDVYTPAEVIDEIPEFVPLSDERFEEIEKLMEECDWCDPINLKDISREERIAFYIKSYDDESISRWIDFNYKKMNNFTESLTTEEQDVEFKKIMELPRNRTNTFKFMWLMTDIQLEVVGY